MEPTMEGEKEVLEEDEDYDEEGKMRIVEQNTKSLLWTIKIGVASCRDCLD